MQIYIIVDVEAKNYLLQKSLMQKIYSKSSEQLAFLMSNNNMKPTSKIWSTIFEFKKNQQAPISHQLSN